VEDPRLVARLKDEILSAYLADNVKKRKMRSDGTYVRVRPSASKPELNSQAWLVEKAKAAAQE
jgi:polyphosphate kinase